MKRNYFRQSIFFLLIFLGNISFTYAIDMGIVTGSKSGTYIKIAKDIANLVEQQGINLTVYPSNGSLYNVADVFERRGVQLGIVQSDVLAFIRSSNDKKLARVAEKIKMVFPLYNEEVHLLASNFVTSFADLEDKVVAIGKEGSGTYLTTSLLFEIAGFSPKKQLTIGGKDALSKLYAGEIDAMFYVSGYPVSLFSEITEEKLHLIPIADKSIEEYYVASEIPAGTYDWQSEVVKTVAVKAVLMSYDYKRNNCVNVGKLAKTIYDDFAWLKNNGHPKWNSVDLDYQLKKWEQYSCVTKILGGTPEEIPENRNSGSSLKDILRGLSN